MLPSMDSTSKSLLAPAGLNMPERRDGDRTAKSLSEGRCRLESFGESMTGDGERGWCTSEKGDASPLRSERLGLRAASVKGDVARAGETPCSRGGASSVGLRAMSEGAETTEMSVLGVPYLALEIGLAGPTTIGVNELALDVDLVVAVSGDLTRGDRMERSVLAGLATLGEDDSFTSEDCILEVLMGVLGSGLYMTGGEETCVIPCDDGPALVDIGEGGTEDGVVSCVGDIGSYGTKTLDW